MARRAGLKDVAAEAGVSVTTVSLILNDHPLARASEQTRQRVFDAAERLNYRPNRVARGLRAGTSEMIGLLTEEIAATPHAGRIILGAQEAASRHNLTLAIINSPLQADADERRDDVRALMDRQVDGIIYATVYHDVVSPPEEQRTVPSVLIGAVDRRGVLPAVIPDEPQGARDAVSMLAELGHRRIAFVDNAIDVPATRGRRAGYLEAMAAADLEVDPRLLAEGVGEARGGHAATLALLDAGGDPTAIFAYNDRMAMGIYRALYERGLRVPEDVSVVGFDDQDPIPESLFPPLTTVALPHYEMGAWAVDTLAAQMADGGKCEGPRPVVRLQCVIVRRESVAPPSHA